MNTTCSGAEFAAVLQLLATAVEPIAAATAVCQEQHALIGTVGPVGAVVAWTVGQAAVQQAKLSATTRGLDTAFLLTSAYLVFAMQMGFALYAAGIIRSRNVSSILMKNFSGAAITAVCFYLVGFAFAFGSRNHETGFVGYGNFALSDVQKNDMSGMPLIGTTHNEYIHGWQIFVFNWAFCAAATAILSGSIAERATLLSYALWAAFFSLWVYPVIAHWNWSTSGWISAHNPNALLGIGTVDFAGSGVVHTLGGFSSLCAAILLGPRVGRFDPRVDQRDFTKAPNPPLYLLGTLMLWFGWYGFNPGSVLSISTLQASDAVGRVAVTTTLSASAGALTSLLLVYWQTQTWDMLAVCTGSLAGLVAITSGCAVVEPWAALICGLVAAPCVVYGELLLESWQIDDPVSAFPLHGLVGIWGMLFVGLLATDGYIHEVYDKPEGHHLMGILYGGHGQLLLCQVIAMLAIIAWVMFWVYGFFWLLRNFGMLRIPLEAEAIGMDMAHMGMMSEHGQAGGRTTGNLFDSKAPGKPSFTNSAGAAANSAAAAAAALAMQRATAATVNLNRNNTNTNAHANGPRPDTFFAAPLVTPVDLRGTASAHGHAAARPAASLPPRPAASASLSLSAPFLPCKDLSWSNDATSPTAPSAFAAASASAGVAALEPGSAFSNGAIDTRHLLASFAVGAGAVSPGSAGGGGSGTAFFPPGLPGQGAGGALGDRLGVPSLDAQAFINNALAPTPSEDRVDMSAMWAALGPLGAPPSPPV